MNAENFESRLTVSWGNDIVLSTDGRSLVLLVEGEDGRGLFSALTPEKVHELTSMLVNWERLYHNGAFRD